MIETAKKTLLILVALLVIASVSKVSVSIPSVNSLPSPKELPSVYQVNSHEQIKPAASIPESAASSSPNTASSVLDCITKNLSASRLATALIYAAIIGVAILLLLNKKSSEVTP